jgi:para-nitrobenzyl esterase
VPTGLSATAGDADLLAAARRRFADPEARLAHYRERLPADPPGRLLSRLITDAFTTGSRRLADTHAAQSTGRTFSYEFQWPSGAYGGRLGACHCVELPYVFGTVGLPSRHGEHALCAERSSS